jgi:hypothetical protein
MLTVLAMLTTPTELALLTTVYLLCFTFLSLLYLLFLLRVWLTPH